MRNRTLYAIVAGLPEHKIRIVSPDIGGGFGNKVGIYPGYVLAVVGSILTGRPVKWVEDRSENLMSTLFARDYHMHTEIASTHEGKILAMRVNVVADHGAFNNTAQPTKFPAGFFHIFTGSYDYPSAYCTVKGVYTNKAPGGVAYACSFRSPRRRTPSSAHCRLPGLRVGHGSCRITHEEPAACRAVPVPIAYRLGVRLGRLPAHPAEGDGDRRLRQLRREQAEKRERGELMGIGLSFFTEGVGAGPRKHMDILGLGMADGAELRGSTRRARPWYGSRSSRRVKDTRRPLRRSSRRSPNPIRRHRCGPWRHRQHPVRAGHVRQPFHSRLGRCCCSRSETCR